MKFGVGVILFNPDIKVISRLEEYSKITNNLFIVDNTEKVKTTSVNHEIKNKFPNYYTEETNLGMCLALEKIFSNAKTAKVDWLLTMDQDSDFSNKNIKDMLKTINSSNDNEISIFCPNYRKIYIDKKNGEEKYGKPSILMSTSKNVLFSMTSGSFCRVSDISNFKFSENLFIGMVDNDLCYDLIDKNHKIKMIGSIIFDQRVGNQVTNSLYNRFFKIVHHNEDRYYYMVRNNLYLQNKYSHNKNIVKSLRFNMLRILINIMLGESKKIKKIKYSYRGYDDFRNEVYGKKK